MMERERENKRQIRHHSWQYYTEPFSNTIVQDLQSKIVITMPTTIMDTTPTTMHTCHHGHYTHHNA